MYSEIFLETMHSINEDKIKYDNFVTTRQGSRVFDIITSNIKNLNTFYTYYDDVAFYPDMDNHQKIPCCKKLRIFSKESEEETIRGSLLHAFGERFPNSDSLPRAFFATLLLMNSNYNIHKGAEYLYSILPENLINDFDIYLGAFLQKTIYSITNPIMGVFSLKSNEDALFSYVDMYENEKDKFEKTSKEAEYLYKCIGKRILNCQRSTFPVEAMIFSLYTMFSQLNYENKNYNEIIDVIVTAYENKIDVIGKTNINSGTIYKVEDEDIKKIHDFLLALKPEEQNEIIKCLALQPKSGASSATTQITKTRKIRNLKKPNKTYLNRGGHDVYKTCKERKGQNRFRNALIAQEEEKCAICNCKISGMEHLIASHIVAWKEATEQEKTDPNNGLLLCPSHDHLFDEHYISFDEQGKIMISNQLSDDNRDAFGINENIKLDITPERELYMDRHRKKLK